MFSNFIGLRKADPPFSHLLDSVALKLEVFGRPRRGNSSSSQFDFTRLTQRRQIVVNGIQSLLPFRRPTCLTAGAARNHCNPLNQITESIEIGVSLAHLHGKRCTPDHFTGIKKKSTILPTRVQCNLVKENTRIEQ